MNNQLKVNPLQFYKDPYSYFSNARQISPVLYTELFQRTGWLVTGYREAEIMLKDPRFIKEANKVTPTEQIPESVMPAIAINRKMMLFRDAPDHTRLRNLVNKAFSPRMVENLRTSVNEIADYLIANMKGKFTYELIRDFSYLLPVFVITDLLGVPKEDRDLFRNWSDAFIKFIDFNTTMEDLELVSKDILDASNYFRNLISKRRIEPKEDLISNLIVAEESGDKLSEDEMIASCLLLLIAGHETTVNLITNGYYLLLKHPEQFELLKNDLTLIPSAIEEILRYESPVIFTSRWAREDFEFAGNSIKKGDYFMVSLGGANYDPTVTTNPEIFDITRKNIKHLSFSSGPHFCLGAPLARLEGQIAIEKLIRHLVNPVLIEEPTRRKNVAFRGFESLKIQASIQ
ncbi:cytochrome [Bacillus sp. AFS077874]|uniref:cytochrome P450 n=1 Tax=unclassified Bacillus (in: firmicutes) TaxID=185979 RepID=UPI000BEDA9E3|nr:MULTISPECIES: cytochrome P450 [unclassified Bacillus (in: firmicutes)]PEC48875.1 cytochrome [Bacillus sp. AFS096315]PFM82895.1 cytochrome [Bacillus sp. AFS077874]